MRRLLPRWLRSTSEPPAFLSLGLSRSIAARLRWSYLISSTLPLLLVGGLLLFVGLSTQQSAVYGRQLDDSARVARDVGRYVSGIQRRLDAFALVVRPGTDLAQQITAAQQATERESPNIADLAVIDEGGRELLRVYNLQAVGASELRDMRGDPGVTRALEQGLTSFTPIARNASGNLTFVLTQPLRNDAGTVRGALRAEVSADPIVTEVRSAAGRGGSYAYLVMAETGTVLIDDGRSGFQPPLQISRLLAEPERVAEYSGARGQAVIGAVTPIVSGQFAAPTGWAVVVEQPSSVAFAGVRRSALLLTGLVVVAGALALAWALRAARRLLLPIEALSAGAQAIGDGHLDHRIAPLDDDELGDVAHSFNTMAEHLQRSLKAIEQQNASLRQDLALARDIQLGLLPERPPWNGDTMAVYARSIPAYDVGGDFYTYLTLSDGRAAIAIGDISGKGVAAALIMALTSSAVESQGRQLEHPGRVLSALNQLLAPRLKANHMNAALLFAVFDPRDATVRVANAGMIAPVLVSPRGNRFIDVGGLPVGAFVGATYQEEVIQIEPGDSILLVSDGVVEAHAPDGELFGFERLEAVVGEIRTPADAQALVELVLDRVHQHMAGADQHDDITIVAIRPSVTAGGAFSDEEQTVGYATL